MEAEAEVSEAAERKQCPEGRGGRDRPEQVRVQQQAEAGAGATVRAAHWGGRPWAGRSHRKGRLCVLQKPLLGPL